MIYIEIFFKIGLFISCVTIGILCFIGLVVNFAMFIGGVEGRKARLLNLLGMMFFPYGIFLGLKEIFKNE